jgi:NADPH:quinone reductase-like Zn-dependent oxidoreductase
LYTAAVAIYYVLLNNKSAPFVTKDKKFEDEYFLVWGGSSSVGAYAVQLAAALGFKVITTCSPSNFQVNL